jgi:hypothetical protein
MYSTSNLFFDILYYVHSCLIEYYESSDHLLSIMVNIMKVKYDKYREDVEKINSLLFVTSLFDPRYKIIEKIKFFFSPLSLSLFFIHPALLWIYTHPLPPSVLKTSFILSSLHHFLFPFLSSPMLLLFFFFLFSLKRRERAETWGERGRGRFVG